MFKIYTPNNDSCLHVDKSRSSVVGWDHPKNGTWFTSDEVNLIERIVCHRLIVREDLDINWSDLTLDSMTTSLELARKNAWDLYAMSDIGGGRLEILDKGKPVDEPVKTVTYNGVVYVVGLNGVR